MSLSIAHKVQIKREILVQSNRGLSLEIDFTAIECISSPLYFTR